MVNSTITIPLDLQTARAFDSASPDEKRKMEALLSLWLRVNTLRSSRCWMRSDARRKPVASRRRCSIHC